MAHPLRIFEWHDLPVAALTFAEDGIRLVVTPFCEDTQDYEIYELLLTEASKLKISIEGEMDFTVLKGLEVTDFDFTIREERLSGELGVLPGNAGYWKIGFSDAIWQLNRRAEQAGASDGDKPSD